MKELKEYLESHPKVKKVWVNKKGQWLFVKRDGFDEKSRAEILKTKDEEAPAADAKKAVKEAPAADAGK